MNIKHTIAIFGASGRMGNAISKSLAKGPYHLLLTAPNAERLHRFKSELLSANPNAKVDVIHSFNKTPWQPDIFILAVPFPAEAEIAQDIHDMAKGKIVISISNPVNEQLTQLVTTPGISAAEELQKRLPDSLIVKAFNTTFAADFSNPVINGKQVDSFVAGDNEESLRTVSELVQLSGFNSIIAGDLTISRTLESMQLLLMQLTVKYNYNWIAGWKILHE
ncbi:MAG TPA: NAD(P)-binding domain-containing protein [Cytophagaceae bacterium]